MRKMTLSEWFFVFAFLWMFGLSLHYQYKYEKEAKANIEIMEKANAAFEQYDARVAYLTKQYADTVAIDSIIKRDDQGNYYFLEINRIYLREVRH